ncbi:MAG: branched-chain amino acid ABC transporter permease [Candidatus Korarchaeum sp.]|nr:branched-chain amino acid ABC transporter permease [Candidatus Korarchaeum sp.]MDW8035659.1 branched-chain amino acid ABC transporter permease [Candidatus Korarchaeum sp.]
MIGSIYALIAVGLALIWGVMNVINFAQADYMALGAFMGFVILEAFKVDPLISLALIFAIVFLLGVLTQMIAVEPILEAPVLSQITVTFSLLLIIRFGLEVVMGPYTRIIEVPYRDLFIRAGGVSFSVPQLIALIVSLAVAFALYLFMSRTFLGAALRATAQDMLAAQLHGINIKQMYRLAFGIGVGISAIGGVLLSLFYPIYPEMGAFFTMIAFICVVLGGFGSIFGAYLGGVLIGLLETISALFISPSLKTLAAFIVFILIILFKPKGLFGR